jgi:hypothetical protein
VLFAVAAVTITAPRLALAFLVADGVVVPTAWRIDLLAVSSVATAVVLTGGTAYLAHATAVAAAGRRVLIALWTAALICSGALIAPASAASLGSAWRRAALGLVDLRGAGRRSRGFGRHARGRAAPGRKPGAAGCRSPAACRG